MHPALGAASWQHVTAPDTIHVYMESGSRPATQQTGLQPERRPLAQARRVALFAREIRESLSQAALDIIFARVEVLSEGRTSGSDFFATVMLTADLATAGELRDVVDAATARRVAELLLGDDRARRLALVRARAEAERLCGAKLAKAQADVRVRAAGTRVHLDVDLQGQPGTRL